MASRASLLGFRFFVGTCSNSVPHILNRLNAYAVCSIQRHAYCDKPSSKDSGYSNSDDHHHDHTVTLQSKNSETLANLIINNDDLVVHTDSNDGAENKKSMASNLVEKEVLKQKVSLSLSY